MWEDVQQNTEEWFNLRLGKATSSNFAKIMVNDGLAFKDPAKVYAQKLAFERITKTRDESSSFSNKNMDRGHEFEPLAIATYEERFFQEATNGGFFHKGDIGDSPDALIGTDGCLEVKSVITNTQWKRLKSQSYDPAYKWQIQGHIWVGDRDWCDFVSFCPEMPEGCDLFVQRVFRDDEMITKLESRLEQFEELVLDNIEILKKYMV